MIKQIFQQRPKLLGGQLELRKNSPAYAENKMPKSTEEMLIRLVRNQGFVSKESLIFCSVDQSENFHCGIQCCDEESFQLHLVFLSLVLLPSCRREMLFGIQAVWGPRINDCKPIISCFNVVQQLVEDIQCLEANCNCILGILI